MDKSTAAYFLTVEELFKREKRLYMWTFTFPEALPSWWCPRCWDKLAVKLRKWYGKMNGVRVMEWHEFHGAHFHVILNKRMSVHVVRRLATQCGFGIIHVVRCDKGAARYLSKYLNKKNKFPFSGRRWVSMGEHKSRVRDIVVDSHEARYLRSVMRSIPPGSNKSQRNAEFFKARLQYNKDQAAGYDWEAESNLLAI